MPTLNADAMPAIRVTWVNPPLITTFGCRRSTVRKDEVAEAEREPLVLPGAERDARLAPQVGHYAHVVLRHRLLEERDVVGLDAARELERVVAVEAAVRVDEELHAGADRFADGPHARDVLRDDCRERARLVATLERVMADDHLEPRVTVGDP
jgi:plasmid stabilization system protein ParE